jgi:hypothetical protein
MVRVPRTGPDLSPIASQLVDTGIPHAPPGMFPPLGERVAPLSVVAPREIYQRPLYQRPLTNFIGAQTRPAPLIRAGRRSAPTFGASVLNRNLLNPYYKAAGLRPRVVSAPAMPRWGGRRTTSTSPRPPGYGQYSAPGRGGPGIGNAIGGAIAGAIGQIDFSGVDGSSIGDIGTAIGDFLSGL